MSEHDHFANARNLAVDILRKETKRTPELISEVAAKASQAATIFAPGATIDVEALNAELRHLFSVGVEDATALDDYDPKGHVPWLPRKRAESAPGSWRFWTRYMTYLERDMSWPPDVVNNLHALTDMILERLEEPAREGPWDRRGMVVGSVQSGKTANYIGLINKAVDSGYKLIIVLAGIHSNLRSQTQLRVDEGVLGFDTQKNRKLNMDGRWLGVGKLPGDKLVIHSLTSSAEKGDFSKPIADSINVMVGGDPVVLVVKKNSRLLGNLLTWVRHVAATEESGGKLIPNVPLLLIDDEADNASINVKDTAGADGGDSDSVSAINGRIREILSSFEKSAYVGYTATPFANIFVNPSAQTEKHGEDIFPRSFIINVKAPSNYVGPTKVFGLDGDPDSGISPHDPLPIVRDLHSPPFDADYMNENAFKQPHKITHVPTALPESLKLAVRCFILVCAARRARGQGKKHNSMLVHVTRFVPVQEHTARLLRDELAGLKRRIEFGDGDRRPTISDELRELWKNEFVPTTKALGDEAGEALTWAKVEAELHSGAVKIEVITVNSTAGVPLDYKEHEAEGRSVIAIGGDKLSRGLTLEGLSISYFLRTSRMYDTLMQMGRWFGYRPGYLDLCRLFTTRTLISWYRHIALAELELRREFDYMVASRQTPLDYGLRVRTHPQGMIVTALNKMCHAQKLELRWSGVLVQTTQLFKDKDRLTANLKATEALIAPLQASSPRTGQETHIWNNVSANDVASFVESLVVPPESARASGRQLGLYIRQQAAKPNSELTRWTIALISVAGKTKQIAGCNVGMVHRTPEDSVSPNFVFKNSGFVNPSDEARDFSDTEFTREWFESIRSKAELSDDVGWLEGLISHPADDVALKLTERWQKATPPKIKSSGQGRPDRANGRVVRVLRQRSHGLLMIYPIEPMEAAGLDPNGPPVIGIALSFPTSDTVTSVEYAVGKVWMAQMQEDDAYDHDN